MTKQTFYLIDNQRKRYACEKVMQAPENYVCEIKEKNRSLEQNAILHKILTAISKTKKFAGKERTIETWKQIIVSGHAVATGGESELTLGLENEVLNLRESTAKMGVKRLSSLLEYVMAWCADNDVVWADD